MKIYICTLLILLVSLAAKSQEIPSQTNRTTVFAEFKPAVITLTNGKTLKQNYANIFLKNSSLLYKHGILDMEADMEADIEQIKSVKFDDCCYVRVDTVLAKVIDTVGNKKILCASFIDIDAYRTRLLNEHQVTNLELGEHVNVTSTDVSANEPKVYPLNNVFYFDLGGNMIKVQERKLNRLYKGDKKRLYKVIVNSADFSWENPASLKKLLELL